MEEEVSEASHNILVAVALCRARTPHGHRTPEPSCRSLLAQVESLRGVFLEVEKLRVDPGSLAKQGGAVTGIPATKSLLRSPPVSRKQPSRVGEENIFCVFFMRAVFLRMVCTLAGVFCDWRPWWPGLP